MAFEISNGITFTGAGVTGCIKGMSAPGQAVKEVDVTCFSDTTEQFIASSLGVAQEFSVTIAIEDGSIPAVGGDATSYVITWPSGTTWTFDGFAREVGNADADAGGDSTVEHTLTIRLTSIITVV